MRVLFDLGHPGHVHLFKHVIKMLKDRGHDISIVVRERENAVKVLLERLNMSYIELYPNAKGIIPKAITMIKNDLKLLKITKKINPDILISMTSPYSAQVSKIIGKPHITFADTEDAKLIIKLTEPFTDIFITEECFKYKFPKNKHISLPTWRPLAYLHPKYFEPDKKVLDYLNISQYDKFFIVRFSAWDASHDWRLSLDITWEEREKIIKSLSRLGEVFISSEEKIIGKIPYGKPLDIPPYMFHDALAFSSGYIGEGHMSAREAVCLGIPSILISPRAKLESVILHLSDKGFLKIFNSYKELNNENITNLLTPKKDIIKNEIKNLVDIPEFLVYFIENYPYSRDEYIKNKDKIIEKFKFRM